MSPRLRKVLTWIAFPAFYLFAFVLFAYLTFPFDRLRDRALVAFAEDQQRTGGTQRLEIDRLSSYWLSGIHASGVRLVSPPSTDKEGKAVPATEIEIEEATVRVALLPLIIGRMTIHFSAELLGGNIEGWTQQDSDGRKLSVELEDVSVGRFTPLVQTIGLPMSGELGGQIDLTLPEGKYSKASGAIALTIADMSVADGKAKIKDAITLPKMVIGDLVLEADISDGLLRITKFAAGGSDLDFAAEGKVNLRDVFAESQADVYARFKFADRYKNKDDKTKALFGAPGSPALFEIADPRIKQSKRADGFYSWRALGLLRSLRFDPAPMGGASPGPGGAKPTLRGFAK